MRIRLDQIDEPFDWRETLELSAGDLERPEVVEIGEVRCRGRIRPTIGGHLLRASLSYRQTLSCMRCLEPVTAAVESVLDFVVLVRDPGVAGDGHPEPAEERALSEEDLGILVLDSPRLDTRPLWLEQIQLNVPMKPLCRKTCAGLCAACGANLNDGPCGCEAATDPRWGALAGLKRK